MEFEVHLLCWFQGSLALSAACQGCFYRELISRGEAPRPELQLWLSCHQCSGPCCLGVLSLWTLLLKAAFCYCVDALLRLWRPGSKLRTRQGLWQPGQEVAACLGPCHLGALCTWPGPSVWGTVRQGQALWGRADLWLQSLWVRGGWDGGAQAWRGRRPSSQASCPRQDEI